MCSSFLNYVQNSAVAEVIWTYLNNIVTYLKENILLFKFPDSFPKTFGNFSFSLQDTLQFNEFQGKLLLAFSTLLLVNIFLIAIAWYYLGQLICDRFMKPASSSAIEELRASVSRLKLPKEHTPRI